VYSQKIAEILYSLDPRRFSKVDYVFLFSFLLLLLGALSLFWTQSVLIAAASLVGMFLAFLSMLLCIGLEDLFEENETETKGREDDDRRDMSSLKKNF
jgi:hypothetical protein